MLLEHINRLLIILGLLEGFSLVVNLHHVLGIVRWLVNSHARVHLVGFLGNLVVSWCHVQIRFLNGAFHITQFANVGA